MDKLNTSLLGEILKGYKNYIFYSTKDFVDNKESIAHGRHGIYGFSEHKVNFKLKPFLMYENEYYNPYTEKNMNFENSIISVNEDNSIIDDRSGVSIDCDINFIAFNEFFLMHPNYGKTLTTNINKSYDLMFEYGMRVKPILHYNLGNKKVRIVGFHDNENLKIDEIFSLEELLKPMFKKKNLDK